MTKELVDVAKRNLRHYLSIAAFKCEGDRIAALNCLDVIEADNTRQRNEGIEAAARVVEKNAEVRFEEHGTREWDTNACYYQGAAGELYEALDEECETIATAIRALKEPE